MQQLEKYFRQLMRRLTPVEMAARELYEAEMQKLSAETAREYADSMVQYHTKRIIRLRQFINDATQ